MKFKQINKTETSEIRATAFAALQKAFAGTNITVQQSRGTFTGVSASLKFDFALQNADGVADTAGARDFKDYARSFGLSLDLLGSTIQYGGFEYKITGLAPKSSRFPLLAERVNGGKTFKLPLSALKSL